jgi:hypothetical protein
MSTYIWPPVSLSISPLTVNVDNVATVLNTDSTDPDNNVALPVKEDGQKPLEIAPEIDTSTLSGTEATVHTLVNNVKKARIVHNGGTEIIIVVGGDDVAWVAPGEKETFDFKFTAGTVIEMKTSGAAGAAGSVYMSFFG